ncbi:uncharacterized protein LOC144591609, partial [Rhinoraja longicauda]
MDHFDFLIDMEQTSCSKGLDAAEGDDNIDEDNGISAQDVAPLHSDNSDLLRFSEPRTQDDDTLFARNLFQISADLGNEMEPGDISYADNVDEEHKNYNVIAESSILSFSLENSDLNENSDSGQIETFSTEQTNIVFIGDVEDKLDASNRSESTSSLESNGSTPWVQAVLLTKRTNETGSCSEESTECLFNASDGMTIESRGLTEPLTPSIHEETDEEMLRDRSEDFAQMSDTATTPDEMIMDPSDVIFLQQEIWHQNQAFIPILTTDIATSEEELGERSNADPVVMPMNCEPSGSELKIHMVEEVIAESCCLISTDDSVSTLPSYTPSVHKELVEWNNQLTQSEDTSYFSFGNQSSSKELKITSIEESLPNYFNPKEALFADVKETTLTSYIPALSEDVLFSDNQHTSMIETFRDHVDDVYQEQDASTETETASQMWNSVNTKASLCDCQEMNQADWQMWSKPIDNRTALPIDQEHLERTITEKKRPINNIYDNVDQNIEGMELSDSPREQENNTNGEIADIRIDNDVIQSKQQPQILPETNFTSETTDFVGLLANGNKPDQEVAVSLAYKLYHLDGFKKTDIAPYIEKNTEFSQMVAEEYLQLFDFREMTLDQALRKFLLALALTGESQERERVLQCFSNRFQHCNQDIIHSRDAVHTLTCAIMLLNSDLHSK